MGGIKGGAKIDHETFEESRLFGGPDPFFSNLLVLLGHKDKGEFDYPEAAVF